MSSHRWTKADWNDWMEHLRRIRSYLIYDPSSFDWVEALNILHDETAFDWRGHLAKREKRDFNTRPRVDMQSMCEIYWSDLLCLHMRNFFPFRKQFFTLRIDNRKEGNKFTLINFSYMQIRKKVKRVNRLTTPVETVKYHGIKSKNCFLPRTFPAISFLFPTFVTQ